MDFMEWFFEKAFGIVFVVLFLGVIIGGPAATFYKAGVEAKIFNNKYHTNYSALDFIYARDTILNYVETGKQSRINLKMEEK